VARAWVLSALVAGAAAGLTACADECCTVDSSPIPVARAPLGNGAPAGAILARAQLATGGAPFPMVVDTSSSVTILSGDAGTKLSPHRRDFNLLDASVAEPGPVRALFRDIGVFSYPLGPVGDAATVPGGVLGGDLLQTFSVEFRFGARPSITFWRHQGASLGFLQDAGYAVLRFTPYGGGETSAASEPDAFGFTGPVTLPATRIVLRGCGAPRAFAIDEPREACCTRGTEISRATGVDLALVMATGAGPVVLSRTAWTKLLAVLPAPPAMMSAPLLLPTWPTPIPADWSTIPRLALVDGGEPPPGGDQGPCVDLARSRRIEWVAVRQQANQALAECVQTCDTDANEPGLALNSAAYVEVGGGIPVAVVADTEPFLQALRFDFRPAGPDIDGLVGAGALGATRVEVDYLDEPAMAIFSCEPDATTGAAPPRDVCYSAPRCPRLPDGGQTHLCFGLPAHHLPATCTPSGC
jgi:hypothetical protein